MSPWPTRPLGEVADVIRGVSFDKAEVVDEPRSGYVPILRAGNISDELNVDSDLVWVPESRVGPEQFLRKNDVAICMSSGSPAVVGKTAQLTNEWRGSVGAFCAIIRFSGLNLRFGALWLRSPGYLAWRDSQAQGANIQNLRKAELAGIPIPLPPLAEQARIVQLLDEAEELRRLRAAADRRTADLIPALFQEMFGDPIRNEMNWPVESLGEICGRDGIKAGPFGSSLKKEVYSQSGPRVYGQEQVIAQDFTAGDYHITEEKYAEMQSYAVLPGDVLISLVGTIGKAVVVPDGVERGIINPRLLRIRPPATVLSPLFLVMILTSVSFAAYLQNIAGGITMGVLNAGILKSVPICLPPVAMQNAFAARVADIRAMQSQQIASRARLDDLFQSTLQRAFEGEL